MATPMRGAYSELGLYWNPFGAPERELWRELIVTQIDLEGLAGRLADPNFALMFRGDSGRGKSTHLRALHSYFPDCPYTYLAPLASPRSPIPEARVVFVDEVERLSPRRRRRLYRRRRALALACHGDLRTELEAVGREVLDVVVSGLDLPTLEEIARRRYRWAERSPDSFVPIESSTLGELLSIHGDDLRTINDALYGLVESQRKAPPTPVAS
jgi:hypothetical protein